MLDGTEIRTPAPGCPACELKRWHRPDEWKDFHPLAGHGRPYSLRRLGTSHDLPEEETDYTYPHICRNAPLQTIKAIMASRSKIEAQENSQR